MMSNASYIEYSIDLLVGCLEKFEYALAPTPLSLYI